MKNNSIYLSYNGILEPLGKSQIVEYLIGLGETHNIDLISFEKKHHIKNNEIIRLKKILKKKIN